MGRTPDGSTTTRVRARSLWSSGSVESVQVAPDLGRGGNGHRNAGRRRLPARVTELPPGPVDIRGIAREPEGWLGILVLDGLLVAEVAAGRAHAAWLLGAEDLVHPWDMNEIALTSQVAWEALVPCRLALLDARFARRADAIPGVTSSVLASGRRTTHWLLAKSLVVSSPVIDERILLLFALLGERWGRVDPEGVHVALPLTHSLIGRLVSARRPSVTTSLISLEHKGVVVRESRGSWLLRRGADPMPGGCWDQYADALGLR